MSAPRRVNEAIHAHYARSALGEAILAALEKAGRNLKQLTPEDLAPVDQFHIRGRVATLELAKAASLDSTKRVLDVGSVVGGTSRCLAREFGCRVTGIDLTSEYCHAAAMLTAKIGLAHLVEFRQGDATNMSFQDHSLDVVWTEHAATHIPDKRGLYREMHRVLAPGGTKPGSKFRTGPTRLMWHAPGLWHWLRKSARKACRRLDSTCFWERFRDHGAKSNAQS